MKLKDLLKGSHRIRQKRKDGTACEYWYAWRGGPQILRVGPLPIKDLDRAILRDAPAAIKRYKAEERAPDKVTLYGLITRYLAAPSHDPKAAPVHLQGMAARTLRDRRTYLDHVRSSIGHMELKALLAPGARGVLLAWRDRMGATPKSADERLYALSCVLAWAVDRGELARNPIEKFDRIYEVDRSDIIWTPEHLELLYRHADPLLAEFVQVSVMTGIRLGDLRSLLCSAVGADAITFQTGKSNRRRTAVVPIFDELRPVLAAIKASDKSLTLLNSSRGLPWSEAGISSAMRRAKTEALKAAKRRGEAASGLENLRVHDMRGTAATNFIRWGVSDDEIATILGWKRDQVSEIRRRYVSGQEIGLAMVRRIRENKARAENVNTIVKPGSQ